MHPRPFSFTAMKKHKIISTNRIVIIPKLSLGLGLIAIVYFAVGFILIYFTIFPNVDDTIELPEYALFAFLVIFMITIGIGLLIRSRIVFTILILSTYVEFVAIIYLLITGTVSILPTIMEEKNFDQEISIIGLVLLLAVFSFPLFKYIILRNKKSRIWFRSYNTSLRSIIEGESRINTFIKSVDIRSHFSNIFIGIQPFVTLMMLIPLIYVILIIISKIEFSSNLLKWEDLNFPSMKDLLIGINEIFDLIIENPFLSLLIFIIPFLIIVYSLFLTPNLFIFPIIAIAAFSWKNPKRILLLRPFGEIRVNSNLRRLIRECIGFFGHVYTLSDKTIKRKRLLRLICFHATFYHHKFKKIRTNQKIDKISIHLNQRFRRNINWFSSFSKIFPISCDDHLWKDSIKKLFMLCDIILIDLTGATTNLIWEIEEIERLNLMKKVLFIVNFTDLEQGKDYLKNFNLNLNNKIYEYDNEGIIEFDSMLKEFAGLFVT